MTMQKINLPLPDDLRLKIQDYRFEKRINSIAEAMRQLIEAGLEAKSKKP
jgi:hypothetical protein